ncbi:unnamed protein product [Meganyctiphanes norvegica]|uniref:Laminin G domain-containing protein n=1 Tax=Meganyctiphanes norvegica TaxID=48144 RepID=A0AAV2Q7I1_MEGNR
MIPMRDTYDDQVSVMVNNISLYIGGVENGIDDRTSSSENFHGCISNIHLTKNDEISEILKEYSSDSQKFVQSESGKSIGLVNRCGAHFVDNAAGIVIGESQIGNSSWFMGGEWVSPEIKTSRYYAVVKEPVVKDTNMDDAVPTVAGLFLALVLVCCIIYLINISIKSKKRKKQQKALEDENEPLFNGDKKNYDEDNKGNYYEKCPDMKVTVQNEEKAPLMSKEAGEYVELVPPKTTPTHTETPTTTTTTTALIESPHPVDKVVVGEPEDLLTSEAPPKPQRQLMDESFEHEKSVLKAPGSQSSSDDETNVEKLPEIQVTEVTDGSENVVAVENSESGVPTSSPSESPMHVEDTTANDAPTPSVPEPQSDTNENSSNLEADTEVPASSSEKHPNNVVIESSEAIPEPAPETMPEIAPGTPDTAPVASEIAPEASELASEVTSEDVSKVAHEDPPLDVAAKTVVVSNTTENSMPPTDDMTENSSGVKDNSLPQLPTSSPPENQLDNNVHDISFSESEDKNMSTEPPVVLTDDKLKENSKTHEESDTPLPPPPPSIEVNGDTTEDKSISEEVSEPSKEDNNKADTQEVSLNGSKKELDSVVPEKKEGIDSTLEATEKFGSTPILDKDDSEDPVEKESDFKELNSPSPSCSLDKQVKRRSKKGIIVQGPSLKPVFLSGDMRSFNNPISYLGGPTIVYPNGDEEDKRRDSTTSLSSIVSID